MAFGMMAVESMACGTPVIVFDGTALPDVIHAPEGGISVPARDSKALADAITGLLKDEQRYAQLVENGLRIVREEYSLRKIHPKTYRIVQINFMRGIKHYGITAFRCHRHVRP